jgi:hypothetical protein
VIAALLLAASLGQCPQQCPPPAVYFPSRYAIVQPPAYYYQPPAVVPPLVLVQPAPYAVQVGPRLVPRRPVLGFLFPWTIHQYVVAP